MNLATIDVPRFGEAAIQLADNGYRPVPIIPGTKRPPMDGWQEFQFQPESVSAYANHYTGLLTGHGVIGLDMDVIDVQIAERIDELAKQCLGKAPVRVGNWPKRLRLYRFDGEIKKRVVGLGDAGKIEILGTGQQFVAYAMHPDTKAPFEWITTASPLTTHSHDLTVVEMRHLDMFVKAVEAEFPQAKDRKPSEQSEHGHIQADERWALHISNIIDGSEMHDSIRALAAGWVRSGMPPGAVVQALRAIVGQSAAKTATPDRWMERYSDIPRAVSTAQQEFPFEPLLAQLPPESLLLSLSELEQRASTIQWSVKGIVPAASLGVIFGASGAFKSFVALDYALSRAWGRQWLGRRTKQAAVVYLAAEGGAGIFRRILAWHKQHGLNWRQCPMHVIVVPLVLAKSCEAIATAIRAKGIQPGDIIVDTLSQVFDGDENAASEIAPFLRTVGAGLRDAFGCTVTLVHHSGHQATERPRGSSAIIANVDFMYGVFRDEQSLMCTLECVKQKDGDKPEPITFTLNRLILGQDEDGDEISSLVAQHADSINAVLESARVGRSGHLQRFLQAVDGGRPEKEVRTAFYSLMDGEAPEARRKAWQRARSAALSAGVVTIEGDWYSAVSVDSGAGH